MLALMEAFGGGYYATQLQTNNCAKTVGTSLEESRVVSNVLEHIATLFDSDPSDLPFFISYPITYFSLGLFAFSKFNTEDVNTRQVCGTIKEYWPSFVKASLISISFFGVLFGRHARLTSLVSLTTYVFFWGIETNKGRDILQQNGMDDLQRQKLKATAGVFANVCTVLTNGSWIYKSISFVRILQYANIISGDQMSSLRTRAKTIADGIEFPAFIQIRSVVNTIYDEVFAMRQSR